MTIEEKLQHFQSLCFQDARERSDKMLNDYTESLRLILEEHKTDSRRQADMQVAAESEKIERDINKQLSIEQISIKRTYSKKQEELKEMLFSELRNKLALFMESKDYSPFLEILVKKVLRFADGSPVTIYLDPSDADKMNRIALHTGAELVLAEHSFLGGIQAEIPSKNILIDHSFKTKLDEADEKFQFRLGGR
ncbi:MAG: V-type ATP synthase subunit E [Clostridium sp.]